MREQPGQKLGGGTQGTYLGPKKGRSQLSLCSCDFRSSFVCPASSPWLLPREPREQDEEGRNRRQRGRQAVWFLSLRADSDSPKEKQEWSPPPHHWLLNVAKKQKTEQET